MIDMQSVSKIFRTDLVETHALRDFTVRVDTGEFVAITGHSGSGKTTLLNVAGLLEDFDGGRYHLDGQDVTRLKDNDRSRIRNEKIGFIFQGFNLIPDLSIYHNVEEPLHYRGMAAQERRERITRSLERGGLEHPGEPSSFATVGRTATTRCDRACHCRGSPGHSSGRAHG